MVIIGPRGHSYHYSININIILLKIERPRGKQSTLNELDNKKPAPPTVHNLSDKELTAHQMQLLEKDPDFNTIDAKPIDFIGALEPMVHHLNISDEDKNSIRYTASNWITKLRPKTNLSKKDARALNELNCDKFIVILPADIGRSTVVMNKSNYKNKAKHLLDVTTAYKVVVGNPLSGVVNQLNAFLLHLKAENKITHRDQQLVRGKDKPMVSRG